MVPLIKWDDEDERKLHKAAFIKARAALLKQNKKSIVEGGASCLYLAPDGSRCAVGHLIDDSELIDPKTGLPFGGINNQGIEAARGEGRFFSSLKGLRTSFLEKLQAIHDSGDVDTWDHAFTLLAIEYDLI